MSVTVALFRESRAELGPPGVPLTTLPPPLLMGTAARSLDAGLADDEANTARLADQMVGDLFRRLRARPVRPAGEATPLPPPPTRDAGEPAAGEVGVTPRLTDTRLAECRRLGTLPPIDLYLTHHPDFQPTPYAALQAAVRDLLGEVEALRSDVEGFEALSETQQGEIDRLAGATRPLPSGRAGPGVVSVPGPSGHLYYACGACQTMVGTDRLFLDTPMGRPIRHCPQCGAELGEVPGAEGAA